MHTVTSLIDLRARRAALTGTLGLVPTMGYLHAGHIALVERARAENDHVAVSIFVNPSQFGPTEDLSTYPRDLDRDLDLLRTADVDLVWTPTPAEVYPPGFQTWVAVTDVSQPLEGAHRPGHFRGVTTVVAKLFNAFSPTRAYFGQKDAQQVRVIQQMARDLNFPLEIIVCPTVREPDGLALSSRNTYLTPEQRAAAPVLYRALQAAEAAALNGERNAETLRSLITTLIAAEPLAQIDYISAADPDTLTELDTMTNGVLFSLAVRFGRTRLIDNLLIPPLA